MVGDGYCHDEANNLECGFDRGDCCYTCTSKEKCINCICHTGSHWDDKSKVLINNGYCNDETNNAACDYDGGDCCKNLNTEHCSECKCFHQKTCAVNPGFLPSIVKDGICNDETNNEECDYDGGDCCSSNINTELCFECICYGKETCRAGIIPSSIGNGFCNDETNNEECNYDGGDCCKLPVNKDLCSNCECSKLKPFYDFLCSLFQDVLRMNYKCFDCVCDSNPKTIGGIQQNMFLSVSTYTLSIVHYY